MVQDPVFAVALAQGLEPGGHGFIMKWFEEVIKYE